MTPLPASVFWLGVLLPALMASFLAEGSKFLFFDIAVCRNSVWFPRGDESMPRPAEGCSLGATGKFAIASGTIFFVSLLVVSLKAPERRELVSTYGLDVESCDSYHEPTSEDNMDTASDQDRYAELQQSGRSYDDVSQFTTTSKGLDSVYESGVEYGLENSIRGNDDDDDDALISHRLNSLVRGEDKYIQRPIHDDGDNEGNFPIGDKYNPLKPSSPEISSSARTVVSESRLFTIEKLQMNHAGQSESNLMIDQLVNELNESFQANFGQNKYTKESGQRGQALGGCFKSDGTNESSFCPTLTCGNDENG
jgi:hypothetical protein